jgi:hypothetical protein
MDLIIRARLRRAAATHGVRSGRAALRLYAIRLAYMLHAIERATERLALARRLYGNDTRLPRRIRRSIRSALPRVPELVRL